MLVESASASGANVQPPTITLTGDGFFAEQIAVPVHLYIGKSDFAMFPEWDACYDTTIPGSRMERPPTLLEYEESCRRRQKREAEEAQRREAQEMEAKFGGCAIM